MYSLNGDNHLSLYKYDYDHIYDHSPLPKNNRHQFLSPVKNSQNSYYYSLASDGTPA